MTDFSFLTVEELGTLLRKRQTTAVDLTKYLSRATGTAGCPLQRGSDGAARFRVGRSG